MLHLSHCTNCPSASTYTLPWSASTFGSTSQSKGFESVGGRLFNLFYFYNRLRSMVESLAAGFVWGHIKDRLDKLRAVANIGSFSGERGTTYGIGKTLPCFSPTRHVLIVDAGTGWLVCG